MLNSKSCIQNASDLCAALYLERRPRISFFYWLSLLL